MNDAARQALYANRDHFSDVIGEDKYRYYPCRHRGELASRIASTKGEPSERMAPTMKLVAALNTELNAALMEVRQLRQQAEEER